MPKFIVLSAGLLLTCAPAALAGPPDTRPYLVLQAGPEESVTSVAVSPDGSLVATGSMDGRARVYDARTGALLRAIGADPSRGVRALAFSPDGKRLACGGLEMDKAVKVWDPRTGALLQTLAGHKAADPGNLYAEVYAVAFSPDGNLLATSGRDRLVLVWDLGAGKPRPALAGHAGEVGALAFAPDGKSLAGGGADRTVRLWDVATGRLVRSLEGHRDWVCALAYSPDGKTLVSGSCDWAYHRGRDPARFEGPEPGAKSEWRLWDVATGRLVRSETEPGRLLSLAVAPDGAALACGAGKDVRLYDLRGRTPARAVTSHDGGVTAVAFTPDGGSLVSGSHDRTARRVALPGGEVRWRLPGYWEQVNAVALSADWAILATGSGDLRFPERMYKAGSAGLGPGAVRVWEARTGRLLRRLGDPAEQIMAVALSPDGRRVAGGGGHPGGKGVARLWDAKTGTEVWSRSDHAAEVLAVTFSADGSSLATAGGDGAVRLRDPATGSVARTLEGHGDGVTSVAFSPDGAGLVCGASDGSASLWDVRAGKLARTFRPAGRAPTTTDRIRLITSAALSPDGSTLATCSASVSSSYGDRVVRVWDARTGELKREITTSQTRGRFVTFSPDGTTLATSGTGKAIALYDARTGNLLRSLVGHAHPPQSVAFSADGRLLVSGGDYRTAKVWEVATGRLLATLVTFAESRPGTAVDDWLATTPKGFYTGSPGVDRFLAWRVGDDLRTADSLGPQLRGADRLEAALRLSPVKPGPR